MGEAIGEKLNGCVAPCVFVFPNKGYSKLDIEDGPFWLPEADRAFHDSFLHTLTNPLVTVEEYDMHINDHAFGILAAKKLHALITGREEA